MKILRYILILSCILSMILSPLCADDKMVKKENIKEFAKKDSKNPNDSKAKVIESKTQDSKNVTIESKDSGVKNLAYSIQVGSFKDIKNAGNLADYLNKKGLDAFFFKENDMYKVRFGNFLNEAQARESAAKLQAQRLIDDFFLITPQSYAINSLKKSLDSKDSKTTNNPNISKPKVTESKTTSAKKDADNITKNVRDSLVKHAHSYLGVPYKWGGESSSGFDCSGLVRAVYRLNGLDLPRRSIEQFNTGKFVPKKDIQVGDLVFFTNNGKGVNHVGIYIGNGKFIHAPGRGKFVKIDNLHSSYWVKNYKGSRRYL
ncbi:NlpC/P60 family protein [Helicobacter saguini]|nr:NlpC/P60 family protein [Helicobacter saguini]